MNVALFLGGTLIRRFDGFRRLCRRAAVDFHLPLTIPDADMLLANRVLAALGGPPAPSEVRGQFAGDGLATLLLFLLTQEIPCRIGLIGETEEAMARVKNLTHVFSHAVYPTITGNFQLPFQEMAKELGPSGAILRPQVLYDAQGEPSEIELTGAAGVLRVGADRGPYSLAIMLGSNPGPAPLATASDGLHPAVLIVE